MFVSRLLARCLACSLFVIPLIACGGETASTEALAHASEVLVVPIEAPPLYFDFPAQTQQAAAALGVSGGHPQSGSGAPVIAAGAPVAAVTAAIALPQAIQAAKSNSDLSWEVVNALSANGTWGPSLVVAKEVRSELSARGSAPIRIREGVQPVAGVTGCELSMTMHNCWGPLRAYRDLKQSPFNYPATDVAADGVVIEAGIDHYELSQDTMILGVFLRVLNPATGATVASGHNASYMVLGSDLFENGGERFKSQFAALAEKVTQKCVKKLGL